MFYLVSNYHFTSEIVFETIKSSQSSLLDKNFFKRLQTAITGTIEVDSRYVIKFEYD